MKIEYYRNTEKINYTHYIYTYILEFVELTLKIATMFGIAFIF